MSEQSGPTRAAILVVDDNQANRLLASAALEDEGYRVVTAEHGEQALAVNESERPDCIVLDVRMPGMDGFTVCERIRAAGFETPVIFVTALRDVDTFDRALRAGADDFLTKPVNPAELVVRVQAAVKLLQLRTELREHYELLRRQRDALLRVQLQKERLTSFLVHDLKNPVNTMDLLAQMLLRAKEASPEIREKAAKIRQEAKTLTRMLLNLLDISKGEEGQLAPRRSEVDLRSLAGDVASELQPSAQQHQVSVSVEIDADSLLADEDMLRRTLTNLLENAIRHTPAGGAVVLSAAQGTEHVDFRVVDTGPGVPDEMRERIFDPFVQLEAGETLPARNSRGLGLSFCRAAVEAHAGRIWVEDADPGAVFCVRIPRPGTTDASS